MDKVYGLPDLSPAPYSELQGLVRRLIEYADLSVLPAIDDELQQRGMNKERERLYDWFADECRTVAVNSERTIRWKWLAEHLMQVFWFVLYDWQATITTLKDRVRHEDEIYTEADVPMSAQGPANAYQVDEALAAGEWAAIQYHPPSVRRATPEEIPATQQEVGNE